MSSSPGISETERRLFITAKLGGLKEKIVFLDSLYSQGHRDEALLLCSCYIDGLAAVLYFPDRIPSHQGFVRVVCEHGGDPFLPLVHPRQMLVALSTRKNSVLTAIRESILPFLQGTELVPEGEFLANARARLDQATHAKLKSMIWRGSMASFAYQQLRSPVIHELRGAGAFSFAGTTFHGKPVPLLSFEVLGPALKNIFAVASRLAMDQEELQEHLRRRLGA